MFTEAFVITRCYGEYEERSETPISVSFTKLSAENAIKRMQQEDEIVNQKRKQIYEWCREYVAKNPRDFADQFSLKTKDYPRWPSGLKESEITKEMRDQRNEIFLHNDKVAAEFRKVENEWQEKRQVELDKFILSLGIPPENLTEYNGYPRYSSRDFSYNITKVNVKG